MTFSQLHISPIICLLEEAPTVHFALRNAKQTAEMQKEKILNLQGQIVNLTEERYDLR